MTAPQVSVPLDQFARLKQLWAAGLPAFDVGVELGLEGDPSQIREAVLRAIEEAARPSSPKTKKTRSNLPARLRTPAVEEDDVDPRFESDGFDGTPDERDLQIDEAQRRSLLGPPHSRHPARAASECSWPVGEPRDPGFFYCGAATFADELYCLRHCRLAYNGRSHRRRAA